METITNEIRQKLIDEQMSKLVELGKDMRANGSDDKEIQQVIQAHINAKIRNFYQKKEDFVPLNECLDLAFYEIDGKRKYDSKAETIFYEMMVKSRIPFKFHYQIGPYTADYLVNGNIVVELDGPQHKQKQNIEHDLKRDAYMIKMGYHIIRLDLNIVALDPEAAIQGIKELINV